MSVKSFTIYKEFNDLIKILKDDQKEAKVVYAIWKYMFEDKCIELDEEQQAIFNNLKRPLDKIKTKSKNKLNKIKNKSKENQKEIEIKTHQDVNVNVNDNVYNNLINYMESNGFILYPVDLEIIENWEDNEVTRYAIKQAVLNKAFSTKYVDKTLASYKSKGIKSVNDAIKSDEEFNKSKEKNRSNNVAPVPDWSDKEFKEERNLSEEDERIIKKLKGSN